LYDRTDFTGSQTIPTEVPKCSVKERKTSCNAPLFKKVKQGHSYKLIPKKVYAYYPIKSSLTKLFGKKGFFESCESWRKRERIYNHYTDVFDGAVWNEFLDINNQPFLSAPYNLCLKLNVDWIQPFDHTQYSMGIIYLAIENLPRLERFKVENIILVGCIPGPREPAGNINSFLSPMVDELLELWNGVQLQTSSIFGYTSVRCALTCFSSDLPATRKVCGFAGHNAAMGCSKCKIKFKTGSFGEKVDYSGYDRDSWQPRDWQSHMADIQTILDAETITKKKELQKKYGIKYSELLRLPYFNVVRYHCVDVMHNLLLGTTKQLFSMWVSRKILTQSDLDRIQDRIDKMVTPAQIGRIPNKISLQGSSFTADQWRNWICIYSLYALHDLLPPQDYNCLVTFSTACNILLQPAITLEDINKADQLLLHFCKTFQNLYGHENCTPNMHLHCHIKETLLDYGPVYATWCFAFERFNGIFESFKKTWLYPEVQLMSKFLQFQQMLAMNMPLTFPPELVDMFQVHSSKIKEIVQGQGSLTTTHIDSLLLTTYLKNSLCSPHQIDACEREFHNISAKRYEKILPPQEVQWLREIYQTIYPNECSELHISMICELFNEVEVLGEHYCSMKSKGSASPYVSAHWADVAGKIALNSDKLRVGMLQHFFLHNVGFASNSGKQKKVSHIFARVSWHRSHPRQNWLPSPLIITSPDFDVPGPSTFIPLSRILNRCAVSSDKIQFDFGEDSVNIASPLYGHCRHVHSRYYLLILASPPSCMFLVMPARKCF